jgi:hypothetical protein
MTISLGFLFPYDSKNISNFVASSGQAKYFNEMQIFNNNKNEQQHEQHTLHCK